MSAIPESAAVESSHAGAALASVAATAVGAIRWFVTDPGSGDVVIAQPPNAPLRRVALAGAVALVTLPVRPVSKLAQGAATVALVDWSWQELSDGDSPVRRVMGAAGLVSAVGMGGATVLLP